MNYANIVIRPGLPEKSRRRSVRDREAQRVLGTDRPPRRRWRQLPPERTEA